MPESDERELTVRPNAGLSFYQFVEMILTKLLAQRHESYIERFSALRQLIDERDRAYIARFDAAEKAVGTALAAAEKAVNAAFLASEKAVLKAEQAQKEYNERSNEFRGQLDDQAKTLMPRPETLNMFKAIEEKILGVQHVTETRTNGIEASARAELTSHKESVDKSLAALGSAIQALRESRSESGGREEARNSASTNSRVTLGLMVTTILALLGMMLSWLLATKGPTVGH